MTRLFSSSLRAALWAAAITLISFATFADPATPAPAPAIPPKPGVPTVLTNYSPGMEEIVKMAQAGVTKDVLLAYIENSKGPYHPTADEIVYLNDLGVSDDVITGLLKKGGPDVAPSNPPQPPPQAPPTSPPLGPPSAPPTNPPATSVPNLPLPSGPAPEAPPAPVSPVIPVTPPSAPPALAPTAPPPAPAAPSAVSPVFYNALSPYGTWVTIPGYGTCWQPSVAVANPAWRPYVDNGHWVYTDSGWYWHSDYGWGWAPFHYGRWYRHSTQGWLWIPGSAWGPAWVSWRYAEGYCGWAPLPPEAEFVTGVGFSFHGARVAIGFDFGLTDSFYAFVPVVRFCDPYPLRFVLAPEFARGIFRTSVVYNNYSFRSGVFINEGIGRERIAFAAHINIPLVRITESRDFVRRGFRHGEEIHVYRPRANQ